jgi:hypothetical protein
LLSLLLPQQQDMMRSSGKISLQLLLVPQVLLPQLLLLQQQSRIMSHSKESLPHPVPHPEPNPNIIVSSLSFHQHSATP